MIVSLTPNTTIDLCLFIPEYVPNTTIRASQTHYSLGGKPTDASWILGRMGVPSLALGLAAGSVGDKVKSMLEAFGVAVDFVEADGETRICTVIIDESSGHHTTITSASMMVTSTHLEQLRRRYAKALERATVVITGGSLPPGMSPDFYAEAITMAHDKNVPVLFDASQPNLSVGLSARPTFIKPNHLELAALAGRELDTIDALYDAALEVVSYYGTQVALTMGERGALAVLKDRSYRIPPLPIEVSSPAGAGDAVLAGLAHAIHHHTPIEEGLRLGLAAAAAVCMQPGTAAYDVADIQRLLPQVELLPYP
jgi:1-phosphofructokinase